VVLFGGVAILQKYELSKNISNFETQTPTISKISKPERIESQTVEAVYIDPNYLEIGLTYTLSRETPIMPLPTPDTVEEINLAIEKIKYAEAGEQITVINRFEQDNTIWYQVKTGTNKGWINSLALVGQSLEQ